MKKNDSAMRNEAIRNVKDRALESCADIQIAKSIQLKKDGDLALFKGFYIKYMFSSCF